MPTALFMILRDKGTQLGPHEKLVSCAAFSGVSSCDNEELFRLFKQNFHCEYTIKIGLLEATIEEELELFFPTRELFSTGVSLNFA